MFNNKFTKKDPIVDVISQIISERWDDDDEDDDVKRADAELRRMKAKPIEADKKTDPDKEIGKLAKKTPKEVDEAVEKKADKDYDKDGKVESGKDEFWGSRLRAAKMKNEDKWTDIADGPWKKSKKSSSQAMSSAHNLAGKGMKDAKSLGRKPDLKAASSKLKAKIAKEEVEQIDELSVEKLRSYRNKSYDQLEKNHSKKEKIDTSKNANKFWNRYDGVNTADEKIKKKTGSYFPSPAKRIAARLRGEEVEITNEAAGPTATYDTDTNFVTSANPTSNPVTPLQRVKGLAVSAKQRLNDSMMGKAGATSEEIDPSVKTTDTLRGRKTGGKSDDVGPGSDFKSTKVKYTPGPK
mgnify:CR=1 FL=1